MYKWARATLGTTMNGSIENGFMRPTRVPYKVLYALLFTLLVVLIVLLLPGDLRAGGQGSDSPVVLLQEDLGQLEYNTTYPLTRPKELENGVQFRIGLVADQDENSRLPDEYTWHSYYKTGTVTMHHDGSLTVLWDSEMVPLQSHLSEKGRGVELSELVVFNGKVYTVDDRSGIVFELFGGSHLVPWVILEDGPGSVDKGFKAEWMAVKDRLLYIGGLGKVWTTETGEYVNDYPQYVKVVNALGYVQHRPWASVYSRMGESAGITSPGYVIHESGCWSDVHRQWFFLPRRASKEKYDDVQDEHRATNILITADEAFADVHVTRIGPFNMYRGFSSFKFVPGTKDSVILALKSEENRGQIATYMLAFDLTGKIRMEEHKIADLKFEGLEFI